MVSFSVDDELAVEILPSFADHLRERPCVSQARFQRPARGTRFYARSCAAWDPFRGSDISPGCQGQSPKTSRIRRSTSLCGLPTLFFSASASNSPAFLSARSLISTQRFCISRDGQRPKSVLLILNPGVNIGLDGDSPYNPTQVARICCGSAAGPGCCLRGIFSRNYYIHNGKFNRSSF